MGVGKGSYCCCFFGGGGSRVGLGCATAVEPTEASIRSNAQTLDGLLAPPSEPLPSKGLGTGVTGSRQVAQSQQDRAATRPKPRWLPSRGHDHPHEWARPGHGLAKLCMSHSKGTLPDIGNLVVESSAAPLSATSLPFGTTMPGGCRIHRCDESERFSIPRSPTDSTNPIFSDKPPSMWNRWG